MKIKILKVETQELVDAQIKEGRKSKLPSMHERWRFNFPKHAKDKDAQVYVLIAEETREVIEGCLIYKMMKGLEPYMAYIEIAAHNKGGNRKYDLVAGCLIAFACRLSFESENENFKGWLAFDVQEESKGDEKRFMTLYSKKYNAERMSETTTMFIRPENGEKLIERYLKQH